MGIPSGRYGPSTALMTREVRWFQEGPLPSAVLHWFTAENCQTEQRVDCYDLASARNGIGRKHRGGSTLDTKFRIDGFASTSLAPRLKGQVGDWMKITEPLAGSHEHALAEPLPVKKTLITRRIVLSDDDTSGCEAELADIEVRGMRAWSLCFETFGAPGRREEAIQAGISSVAETPLPNGVAFGDDTSLPYPDWITRLAYQRT